MKRVYVITGMHCTSCAKNIEFSLQGMSGIASANVHMVNEKLFVDYSAYDKEIEKEVMQKVKKLGYGIEIDDMKTIRFIIDGMHCASCSANIEKVLQAEKGIDSVFVNLTTQKATIVYQEHIISVEAIVNKITAMGYQATEDSELKMPEYKHDLQKLIFVFIFSIPLFIISMAPMLLGESVMAWEMEHRTVLTVLQLFLTIPIMLAGKDFYIIGFKSLSQKIPNMDSLVAIGTSAAFAYSLFNSYLILFYNQHMLPLYYESVGVIISLIMLGKYFEKKAKSRTSKAIERLSDLRPKTAILLVGTEQKIVDISEIHVGNLLLVKPGTAVPTDGVVVEGESSVDESMLTGESIPVYKDKGTTLTGASVNGAGSLVMRVTKVGTDTVLFQIIRMIEEAQGSKAPIARLADQVAGVFVPIVMGIATVAFVFWLLVGMGLSFALTVFVSVLVIACPCALGLATPTAILVGTGRAAEKGILFKGGMPLEQLKHTQVLLLDKTGTITQGKPRVMAEFVYGEYTIEDLYAIAKSLEEKSEHPLAEAILTKSQDINESKNWKDAVITNFTSIKGKGVKALLVNKGVYHEVWMGSTRLKTEQNIELSSEMTRDESILLKQGATMMYLAVDGSLAAMIGAKDMLKNGVHETIEAIKKINIEPVLLTGDHRQAAQIIAEEAGIDRVISDVLPEHKVEEVKRIQALGKKVTMVGDGINDAPALTQADVGMAVGNGTDVAIESADIVLMNEDILSILTAIEVSRKTLRNIKQNLFWAFFYNILGIPIAAGILYPMTGILLSPMIAAGAMAFSSVSVVANALRLKRQI